MIVDFIDIVLNKKDLKRGFNTPEHAFGLNEYLREVEKCFVM